MLFVVVIIVQRRYRYRIEPTEVQRPMLARTFGCARVVFNDAIQCRTDAYRAGEKISPTEVQRRVVTEAKMTEARSWLGEVASVALVQSVRDAHRAYQNWFDSITQRRLEREKARRAKGGKNRAKTRRKVAAQHGKVARARRDYRHKQALALVRDNQAIHIEDLNVAGMIKNRRLARAIHDAGWAGLVRLLEEKAQQYGRTVAKVSRWLPSSKTCSMCGNVMEAMPLKVRTWTCPECATKHDRDYNAAVNILAAGQAERLNACGARVSPSFGEAVGDEAGTTPDAA